MTTDVVVANSPLYVSNPSVIKTRAQIGAAFLLAAAVLPATVINVPALNLGMTANPPTVYTSVTNPITTSTPLLVQQPTVIKTQRQTQNDFLLIAAGAVPQVVIAVPPLNLSFTGFPPSVTVEEYVPFWGVDTDEYPAPYFEPTPLAKRVAALFLDTKSVTIMPPPSGLTMNFNPPVVSIGNFPTIGLPSLPMAMAFLAPTVLNTSNTNTPVPAAPMNMTANPPTVNVSQGSLISVPLLSMSMSSTPSVSNSASPVIGVPPLSMGMSVPTVGVSNTLITVRVQATQAGDYANEYYDIGDVFDVDVRFFANSSIDFASGYPASGEYGWMKIVPASTPLFNSGQTIRNAPRRTVF